MERSKLLKIVAASKEGRKAQDKLNQDPTYKLNSIFLKTRNSTQNPQTRQIDTYKTNFRSHLLDLNQTKNSISTVNPNNSSMAEGFFSPKPYSKALSRTNNTSKILSTTSQRKLNKTQRATGKFTATLTALNKSSNFFQKKILEESPQESVDKYTDGRQSVAQNSFIKTQVQEHRKKVQTIRSTSRNDGNTPTMKITEAGSEREGGLGKASTKKLMEKIFSQKTQVEPETDPKPIFTTAGSISTLPANSPLRLLLGGGESLYSQMKITTTKNAAVELVRSTLKKNHPKDSPEKKTPVKYSLSPELGVEGLELYNSPKNELLSLQNSTRNIFRNKRESSKFDPNKSQDEERDAEGQSQYEALFKMNYFDNKKYQKMQNDFFLRLLATEIQKEDEVNDYLGKSQTQLEKLRDNEFAMRNIDLKHRIWTFHQFGFKSPEFFDNKILEAMLLGNKRIAKRGRMQSLDLWRDVNQYSCLGESGFQKTRNLMKFFAKDVYRRKVKSQPVAGNRPCNNRTSAFENKKFQPVSLENLNQLPNSGGPRKVPPLNKTKNRSVHIPKKPMFMSKPKDEESSKPKYNYLGTAHEPYDSWRISANKRLENQKSVDKSISKIDQIVTDTIFLRHKTKQYKNQVQHEGKNLNEYLEKVIKREEIDMKQ